MSSPREKHLLQSLFNVLRRNGAEESSSTATASSTADSSCKELDDYEETREIVDSIIQLKEEEKTANAGLLKPETIYHLGRCIIQAHSVRVFKARKCICGQLARFIHWFLNSIDPARHDSTFRLLLREEEFDAEQLTVERITNPRTNIKHLPRATSKREQPSISMLLNLLSIGLAGQETDAVIGLLSLSLLHLRKLSGAVSDAEENSTLLNSWTMALGSEELMKLFFNPLIIKKVTSRQVVPENCEKLSVGYPTTVTWSDNKTDYKKRGDVGPRRRPDDLIFHILRSAVSASAINCFFANLVNCYDDTFDFSKTQLHAALEVTLSKEVDAFQILCDKLTENLRMNRCLVLSTVEYFFVSPVVYRGNEPSYDQVRSLTAFLVENSDPKFVPPLFFKSCIDCFVSKECTSQHNRGWLHERLVFLSFFFEREGSFVDTFVINTSLIEYVCKVFLFVWELGESVFPAFRSIMHYCQQHTSHIVFSSFLKVSSQNANNFRMLFDAAGSGDMLRTWAMKGDMEDTSDLLKVLSQMNPRFCEWPLKALRMRLQTVGGSSAVARVDDDTVCRTVCQLLIDVAVSQPGFADIARDCLNKLALLMDCHWKSHVVNTLMLTPETLVHGEMPEEGFKKLLDIFLFNQEEDSRRLDNLLLTFLNCVNQIDASKEVKFFDNLLKYLKTLPQSQRNASCHALAPILHRIFELLEEDRPDSETLKELVRFVINKGSREKQVEVSSVDVPQSYQLNPFSSAKFPEGEDIQAGEASIEDLDALITTFKSKTPNLENVSMRQAILKRGRRVGLRRHCSIGLTSGELTQGAFIPTETTEENIRMIKEKIDDGSPVLLIGTTGVGKVSCSSMQSKASYDCHVLDGDPDGDCKTGACRSHSHQHVVKFDT